MAALAASLHAANFIEDFFALCDLTEDGVAPALHVLASMIQKVVILHIDEELCRSGVGVLSPRHRNGAALIFQAVVRFVIDGGLSRLLFHVGGKSAALNHKIVNDSMENRAVVEATIRVRQKILDGLWRLVGIEFKCHLTDGRGDGYVRCWHVVLNGSLGKRESYLSCGGVAITNLY